MHETIRTLKLRERVRVCGVHMVTRCFMHNSRLERAVQGRGAVRDDDRLDARRLRGELVGRDVDEEVSLLQPSMAFAITPRAVALPRPLSQHVGEASLTDLLQVRPEQQGCITTGTSREARETAPESARRSLLDCLTKTDGVLTEHCESVCHAAVLAPQWDVSFRWPGGRCSDGHDVVSSPARG